VYLYDANGSKQIKKFFENGKQKNAEYYVGSIIYETDSTDVTGDKLKYVMTGDGRITKLKDGTFRNEYFLKDHLGNTRVVFADTLNNGTASVIQETSYYPFGLAFTGPDLKTDKNKFLYNGKELQTDGDLGMYDYGARFYDPQIGRFTTIDPLMEWHFNYTPYHYCFNNPISFVDPDGLDSMKVILPQVVVTEKKPGFFSKIWKWFKNHTNQNGGNSLETDDGGPDPTPIKAKFPGPPIHIDDLLALISGVSAGTYEKSTIPMADALNNAKDAHEEAKNIQVPLRPEPDKQTSDKEIGKKSMGSTEPTKANGQPIESDSIVVPLMIKDNPDDKSQRVYQDYKMDKNSQYGRPVGNPHKILK
jgi:RHS repeat-associated protein